MTRFVIRPEVALQLAAERAHVHPDHELLAPALLRSQVLTLLHRGVLSGALTRKDAERQLVYVRGLHMRLPNDRVMQSVAWQVAERLGWDDTYDAEYVALARLQADALVALDDRWVAEVGDLVPFAPYAALMAPGR